MRFDDSIRSTSTLSNKSQIGNESENKMDETSSVDGSDDIFHSPNESLKEEETTINESVEMRLESVQSPKGRRSYNSNSLILFIL